MNSDHPNRHHVGKWEKSVQSIRLTFRLGVRIGHYIGNFYFCDQTFLFNIKTFYRVDHRGILTNFRTVQWISPTASRDIKNPRAH